MRTRLRVLGMTCQHCVNAVFTALTPVEGIIAAEVEVGSVTVEHDGRTTVDALREAIAVAGYEAVLASEKRRQLPVM
ncbi:MAG: heavy-metal-associated domain-containing protein [Gemmatimonadaceae bacterium]